MKTNIAEFLPEVALKYPYRRAVIFPEGRDLQGRVSYTHVTFSQLENLSNLYASAFCEQGIKKGMKVSMFLRPGLDFIATVFAVFKIGAVPVLIDPGMGRKNLLDCIKKTAPEALIAVAEVHWMSYLFLGVFKSINIRFTSGKCSPPWIKSLEEIAEKNVSGAICEFEIEKTELEDTAAILFTTGSTGPPKGVVYTHRIFIYQVEIISSTYGSGPSEMDMPAFPLFALFSSAMGMSCVIPDMDPTRPAQVNPEKIVEAVLNQGVSFSFGSPALWRAVAVYCLKNKIKLKPLKKVLMAGAPVQADLHQMLKEVMGEGGETMVPYGATESLPIASFNGSEMLSETAEATANGEGYCVGYPLKGLTIKIIKCCDDPIPKWNDELLVPDGKHGEIVIKGPVVTPEYLNMPEATEKAKILDSDGKLWHRMGDIGYFDSKGRLWFCGRKTHRVITETTIFLPVCCEAIFNHHPQVYRTALVGTGKGSSRKPVLIVEPLPGKMPTSINERENFIKELKELGSGKDFTKAIDTFLFHPSFPVDIRHNAKIFREKLSVWAEKKLT